MSTLKKLACGVLSAGMLLTTLAFSGCSTPKVAMTVDGKDYFTGEYLAYLYNAYYNLFYGQQQLAMYAYYGQDVWNMDIPYGDDEDSAIKLKTADYIKQSAKDTVIRQKAIENKLKETGLKWLEDDVKKADEQLAGMKENQLIALGISKDSYASMYRAYTCNESALFYGTYDKGGSKAMSDDEIRKYFNDNYLSYKIIEMSLVDSEGKDLSAEKKKEVTDALQRYLNQYNTSKDFDKVIETYNADEAAKTSTSGSATTTAAGSTTTTAATTGGTTVTTGGTTSATSSGTTTTAAGSTTTTTGSSGDKDDEEEENKDPNRKDIDANIYGDEDFTNAVKSVKVDEAKIVEYKKSGTTNTAALILRLDPEKRLDGKDYFAESRKSIIYGAKFKDYDKELKEYIAKLDVKINNTAVKMCDPKKFGG